MDFETAAQLSAYLSKDYAEDFFKLLVNYQDISASEAASRLSLHIRTAQDFLDGLTALGIVNKTEVHEKKRPYYRYNLAMKKITLEVDLNEFAKENPGEGLARLVREKKDGGANFKVARSGNYFSSVIIWEGDGREREVHDISLTTPQGKFLFHLPFPQARPLTIADVMENAGVEMDYSTEIQDIVDELVSRGVIEIV
jgi:predicted transcriptional regulator